MKFTGFEKLAIAVLGIMFAVMATCLFLVVVWILQH
jgi:uncharacterized membrane protein YbaN (DUF454 family)